MGRFFYFCPVMQILYEDNHLLVLNKPAGLLVQGDKTGDPTLTDWGKEYLKEKYQKPGAVFLTPCHRIDRPVSGLVLCARTDKALGRVTDMFRTRTVQKTYLAAVTKAPAQKEGALRHWLIKDEQRNRVTLYNTPRFDAKECLLEYKIWKQLPDKCFLIVHPLTGRPHQIRSQLASMGSHIIGDVKYGAPYPLSDASIALHSWSLGLEHPVRKEPVFWEAPLPQNEVWKY
jgi:23S rRNA pseudouridine1911/1915/1917 synthase